MSRQSDNSKAGSEGNGDSMVSSYQNSPRKTPEFGSAGPFGDRCTDNKSPNCYIFMMDNESSPSENEDQQASDLKAEYLERLDLIRQKLASIDIANYGSYYNNGYGYPSSYSPSPGCQITEIYDESPRDTENNNTGNVLTETKQMEVMPSNNEAILVNADKDKVMVDNDSKASQKGKRRKKSNYTDSGKSNKTNLSNNCIENTDENTCENSNLKKGTKSTKSAEKFLPKNEQNIVSKPSNTFDLKNVDLVSETLLKEKNENSKSSNEQQKNVNAKEVTPTERPKTEILPCKDFGTKKDFINEEQDKNILRIQNININEPSDKASSSKSKNFSTVKNALQVGDSNIKDFMTECDDNKNTVTSNNFEVQTIFKFDNPYDVDSAVELIDLNYNPPKKKYCVREKTPQLIMSDGAMSLPYHIRVSLHSEALKKKEHESIEVDEASVADQVKKNVENLEVKADLNEDKVNHIFPEVQVDCCGDGDQEEIAHRSSEILHTLTEKQAHLDTPTNSAGIDNEYNVFFFDTVEQSPLESVRSHRTIVTETTISDSSSRKPKRRRLFLRSAQNKVKPVDKISLWEEIRTTEAINKQKQESSSSLESYFKDVIIYKEKPETDPLAADLTAVENLDDPPKTKTASRFPSITKITKLCTSIFRKKSSGTCTENNIEKNEQFEEKTSNKKRVIENSPKAAHMLLNVRKEQDLDVEIDEVTPSEENFSECTEVDEGDDSYYEGICQNCFCF